MSRYSFTADDGVQWAAGYDASAGAYFLDSHTDQETMTEYGEIEPILSWADLDQRAAGLVDIPSNVRARLRAEDPVSPTAARASALAHMDQVAASVRAEMHAIDAREAAQSRPGQRNFGSDGQTPNSLER